MTNSGGSGPANSKKKRRKPKKGVQATQNQSIAQVNQSVAQLARTVSTLALGASQPLPSRRRKRRPRAARGAGSTSGGPTRVGRYLQSLRRGMPSTVPTRVEVLHFRDRFTLNSAQGLMILFHPSNSVSLGLCMGSSASAPVSHRSRTTETTENSEGTYHNWAPGLRWSAKTGESGDLTATTVVEAIGTPGSLLSSVGRVTGGLLSIKIVGSGGSSGYLVSSCPLRSELESPLELYKAHASSTRLRRHEVTDGVQDFVFHAPLVNPASLDEFSQSNDQFNWGVSDPFGGVLVTFHQLNFNANLGNPFVVEVDMQVGVQSRLSIEDRHLATAHSVEKSAQKASLHEQADSGHVHSGTGAGSNAVQVSNTTSIRGGIG